jgi:hypothetical protein
MNHQELKEYLENTTCHGVLATADAYGLLNQAVFARPHVMEDGTAAFIMPHRLTHKNLQENSHGGFAEGYIWDVQFVLAKPRYRQSLRSPSWGG